MSKNELIFKATALKDLKQMPVMIRRRILTKLEYYAQQLDPLRYATKLTSFSKGGDYRFRIGRYRVVFDVSGDTIYVLHIEHRKDVYRSK